MIQNYKRLSGENQEKVLRYIKHVKARRRVLNHAAPLVSIAVGLTALPLAIHLTMVAEWAVVSIAFTLLFLLLDLETSRRRARINAHWVRPTKPGDTGPFAPR